MRRGLDFDKAEAALKRAAYKATHGTREERSARFCPVACSTLKAPSSSNVSAIPMPLRQTSGANPDAFYIDLIDLFDQEITMTKLR